MGNSDFPLNSSLLGCKSIWPDALLESSRVIGFWSILEFDTEQLYCCYQLIQARFALVFLIINVRIAMLSWMSPKLLKILSHFDRLNVVQIINEWFLIQTQVNESHGVDYLMSKNNKKSALSLLLIPINDTSTFI